jgi:hypothetical protein
MSKRFRRGFRRDGAKLRGGLVEALEGRQLLSSSAAPPVVAAEGEAVPGTLVPDVSASLPEAVVAGGKVRPIPVVVNLTNVDAVTYGGPVTVTLFATANETFEGEADPQLAVTTKRLTLESGQSKAVKLRVSRLPALPDGDYRVLARVTAPGVELADNVSFNTVNVAAPFVDLAGTFAPTPATLARGKRARLSLTLTNAANSAVKATVPVAITASPPPDAAGGTPVSLGTVNAKVALKAGQTKAVRLSVTVPADAAPGSYFLDAVLDPANVLAEGNETNNAVTGTTAVTIA